MVSFGIAHRHLQDQASDLKIRFWVNETNNSGVATEINTGDCLVNASGCFHQVSGVAAAVTRMPSPCGPDANYQANQEITISNSDSTLLAPGQSWCNVQVALHVGNYSNFDPGASDPIDQQKQIVKCVGHNGWG
jgi:hypothetical protein